MHKPLANSRFDIMNPNVFLTSLSQPLSARFKSQAFCLGNKDLTAESVIYAHARAHS
jgi:hypothetical protein